MRWPWLVVAGGLAAAASCALDGFQKVDATGTTSTTATTGTGGSAPVCESADYPAPPNASDGGLDDAGTPEIVAAIRKVLLVEQADGGALGVDLDSRCSCQGEEATCVVPPNGAECDLAGGRDNALSKLFTTLQVILQQGDISDFYSAQAESGKWSLLLRIRGYDGELDDSQVEVAWYVAVGSVAATPLWDGTDGWRISSDSVTALDLEQPLYVDTHAYVTNGLVVASLPSTAFTLAGSVSRITFRLTAGGLIGRLVHDGQAWGLRDGILAGRVSESDLFYAVSSYRDDNGAPLCTDSPLYGVARDIVCNGRDILSGLGGPSTPCDAVSMAIGFEADPALLGPVEVPIPPTTSCAAGTDPIDDACPP